VTQPAQHHEQDEVSGILPEVVGGAGPLVQEATVFAAAECAKAEGRAAGLRGGRDRRAMGAGHRRILRAC
jgi:hypothetical protein